MRKGYLEFKVLMQKSLVKNFGADVVCPFWGNENSKIMYFPGKDKKGGDLKPSLKFAKEWLPKELSYLKPNLYLVIGRLAAEFFFPRRAFLDLVSSDQQINGKLALVLPHPSPLNIKWFKDNPTFEKLRIPIIRKYIHQSLTSK